MSAIWGYINLEDKPVSKKIQESMEKPLSIYKLDLIKSLDKNNVFLGCGLQYITPESLHEVLPYYDEKNKIALTADAIIDNREELFNLLNVPLGTREKITDSELILISYKKWGKDCPKYLVGDFAFVIWDEKNKEIFCARDHVGARTFYYYYSNNTFIFSTLVKPIIAACDYKKNLNERWIADFLALPGVIHQSECEETIYENIFQLPPGHTITINSSGIKKDQYWNPLKNIKKLKLKSDKEYYEAFTKIFTEAVNCRLRCNGDVGILLSGGLDSGSVACIAAKKLKEEGKRLKAFSFIPIKDLKYEVPQNRIADESEYIEALVNHSGNIDATYCRCEGKDSIRKINWFINVLEQPYKNIENSFWADELTEKASQNNCKVILNGQYGNSTISNGVFISQIITLFKKANLIKVLKEIDGYGKLYNISRLYVAKEVAKEVAKVLYHSSFRKFQAKRILKVDKDSKYGWSIINKEIIKKWDIEKRFIKQDFILDKERFLDMEEIRRLIVNPVAFTQISTVETKTSLAYGVIKRDPTKDKRIIEFCLSLPDNQYVKDGEERRLIRRSMEGLLPDKVRLNYLKRGIQYADWLQRLDPKRMEIYREVEKIIEDKRIDKYINMDGLKKELNILKDDSNDINMCNIRMLIIAIAFAHFIKAN